MTWSKIYMLSRFYGDSMASEKIRLIWATTFIFFSKKASHDILSNFLNFKFKFLGLADFYLTVRKFAFEFFLKKELRLRPNKKL
jgi:hypothetical protein